MFPIGFHRRCQPASQLAGGPVAATLAPPQPRGGGQQGLEAGRSIPEGPTLLDPHNPLWMLAPILQSGQAWESVDASLPSSSTTPRVAYHPWGQLVQVGLHLPAPQACGLGGLTLLPSPRDGSSISSGSGCDPVPLENFCRTNEKEGLLGLPGIRTPPGAAKASCGQGGGPAGARRPPQGGTLALVTLAGPPDPAEPEGEAAPRALHSQRRLTAGAAAGGLQRTGASLSHPKPNHPSLRDRLSGFSPLAS